MVGLGLELTAEEQSEILRKQEVVSILNACGAFDVRGGSFTAHFDADGALRKVDRNDSIYRTPPTVLQ